MTALVEPHPEDLVARFEQPEVDGHVRLGPAVGLHVGVLGAEQGLGALDGERLDLVHDFAALVVAPPGVPLGVLVGEHRTGGLHDRARHEVLGCDQVDVGVLALDIAADQTGELRVDLLERLHAIHGTSAGRA